MLANDIDEVLERLEEIVERSKFTGDRLGLFAALYAVVTREVKRRIETGFFEDGSRMNLFDTVFANRYLEALREFHSGRRPTRSWRIAFEAGSRSDLIVLQQLLLGVNAHINLDLGVAAAALFTVDELPRARGDFDRVNEILAEVLERSQSVIARFSPLLGILDQLGGRTDEHLVNFSIERARADAWMHAELLVQLEPNKRALPIDVIDHKVAFLGRVVSSPDPVLAAGIHVIALTESREYPAIIDALDSVRIS